MKRYLTLFLALILFLTACGSAAATPAPVMEAGAPSYSAKSLGGAAPSAPSAPVANDAVSGARTASNPTAQERIVIQTVQLSLVIKDPQAKLTEISALAVQLGGFVVSSNMSQVAIGNNRRAPQGSIEIRVPAKSLDTALTQIKANVIDVPSENRGGQDVTDKFVDLQSQLKAKQAAADQLYLILQKTDKAEDTLAVFNQLTQVQSDIEVLKGQINYYQQASDLSAITIQLIPEATIQPLEIAGWKPQGVARDAAQALITFFQNFVDFLIWLVIYILPVAVVIILLLALLWRLFRWLWLKLFPRKPKPQPAPPAEAK